MLILAATAAGRGPGIVVLFTAMISATFMLPPLGSIVVAAWQDRVMLLVFAVVGAVLIYFGSQFRLIGRKAADAEQRLALAQRNAGVGLFEIDLHTERILGSAMLWELLGLPIRKDWVPLEEWMVALQSKDASADIRLLKEKSAAQTEGYRYEYEHCIEREGQEPQWLVSRVHVEYNASGKAAFLRGATVDITRRKKLEAAVAEADRRKNEFLAILAHELRNPLAPIRQAAAIFRSPNAMEAHKRQSQEIIERQVKHMALLLDDLLDVSRITRGVLELRKEPAQLIKIVDSAVETARPFIDAREHSLSIDISPPSIRLSADPLRLAQVLTNLLTNAAKFTGPRGTLQLIGRIEGPRVVVRVLDNGAGIAPAALPGLFQMFSPRHTYEQTDGGLGIGLAFSKGIVELHGGEIRAHSAGPGLGSEFTVSLPAA